MADSKQRGTGNDALEGVDPGGTRSTRPGNPDKSGPARPEHVADPQRIVSGDRNDEHPDAESRERGAKRP